MRKGFTLVELLIVLAVIAALMAVATPLALNAVKNAKASQVAQNFRNVKAAVENYVNVEKPTNANNITLTNLVNKKYLSAAPANFDVTATYNDGIFKVIISYTGKDVDQEKLREYYSEVSGTTLTFEIQKWW
ncbi:type II secretion system protein [Fervidobacterium thailandense]|uniref:Prepilin-type N-terminal cleavage/methylation domain-containing protein n=1 Tax=Fervidobacterium thailandense TaxID=1008305 RepID=A0A1E3G3J8_9BACT|nr:type II secretion system protein [Fervidobacterium thailandense]ODN30827.1 prepilin-type N-terminal cleavage/methylation domain-containing protein [Fervidobacterium thailandense]